MSGFRFSISSDSAWCPAGRDAGPRRLLIGAVVFAQLVLSGCQTDRLPARVVSVQNMPVARTAVTPGSDGQNADSASAPGPVITRLEEVTGTLKAIDRRGNRIVVRMDNGKLLRLQLSGLPKSGVTVRTGQRIGISLRESVEIIRNRFMHAADGQAVAREAPGSSGERENYNSYYNRPPTGHHGTRWVEVLDIPARVVRTYPERSEIRLITQRGRQLTVKVSDSRHDVGDIAPNESVIVRFREADEIYPIED